MRGGSLLGFADKVPFLKQITARRGEQEEQKPPKLTPYRSHSLGEEKPFPTSLSPRPWAQPLPGVPAGAARSGRPGPTGGRPLRARGGTAACPARR